MRGEDECKLLIVKPIRSFFRMTDFDKPYKNYDELIKILENRNLDIIDEDRAKNLLQLYGYYPLINGYKRSFTKNNSEEYKSGYNLGDIYSLYLIDSEMQELFLTSVLKVEKHLANTIGNIVAKHFGVDNHNSYLDYLCEHKNDHQKIPYHYSSSPNSYLTEENYSNVTKHRKKVLKKIIYKIFKCSDNPIAYYKKHHNHIPPWILVQNLTFGETVNYYQIQKSKLKNEIVNEMITSIEFENIESKKSLFYSETQILSFFRNTAAHASPIYLFKVNENQKHFTVPSRKSLEFYLGQKIFEPNDPPSLGKNDLYAAFLALLLLNRDSLQRKMFINKLSSLEHNYKDEPAFSKDYDEYIKKAGLPINYINRLESASENLSKNELGKTYKTEIIDSVEHTYMSTQIKHPINDFGAMKKVYKQDSQLYHLFRNCQYLKKQVEEISFQEAAYNNLRLCKKCKARALKE